MHPNIFNLLRIHSDDIFKVNSLIISAYLRVNGIKKVINKDIRKHIISSNSTDAKLLDAFIAQLRKEELDFEGLIELFEFVISPSDKIVNGAVYTPCYIREYIVNQCFERLEGTISELKVADISCGCGGFLLTAAQKLKKLTGKAYFNIFAENIYGADITGYSVERAKLLLSLYAIVNGEDNKVFKFNLRIANSLNFDWRKNIPIIELNGGFDLVIGNPPYVTSRNMDTETLRLSQNYVVAKTGHPDLYIPFFQIGYELLSINGILGYITVNTFIKSINGRALRQYFHDNDVKLDLIDFGGEQIFQDRNTYTCICFLSRGNGQIRYRRCLSEELSVLNFQDCITYKYEILNHFDGWNLANAEIINEFISVIERTGRPFKEKFKTRNGIATLKNNVYKFVQVNEDDQFYFLAMNDEVFPIERALCRNIVNANKIKTYEDLNEKLEKIIFPYTVEGGIVNVIPEERMQEQYPFTYQYLLRHREMLSQRDKGKREYEVWYAYGRRQSMDINEFKLLFPHICEKPRFIISQDTDLLFYNGIAVISEDLDELLLLKRLLETDIFYYYIRATTKNYSSGYISMSRNYLKNFGIYEFTEEERHEFLSTDNPQEYIKNKYNVKIPEMEF